MLIVIGAILFFIIGLVLSLIGSGGAILTIPVLVYIFDIDPYLATSYSMFIMGASNWIATIDNIKKSLILYRPGLFFSVPGLIITYFTRRFVLPYIPDILFKNELFFFTKSNAIMLVFTILMFIAAIKSLRGKDATNNVLPINFNYKLLATYGAAVGLVTGFVGAGGGFLIIPAFVFIFKTPMIHAIATSIFIIAINTSLGFIGDLNPTISINWPFLVFLMGSSISGVILANKLKHRLSNEFLRNFFGLVIFFLAIFVSINELYKLYKQIQF